MYSMARKLSSAEKRVVDSAVKSFEKAPEKDKIPNHFFKKHLMQNLILLDKNQLKLLSSNFKKKMKSKKYWK